MKKVNYKNYTDCLQIWLEPETLSTENLNELPTIVCVLLAIQSVVLNDELADKIKIII